MKPKVIITRIIGLYHTTQLQHPLDKGDELWLRWVVLSISVLFCVAILLACGAIGSINAWHTGLLQGAPFHLSAAGVEAGSILSPAASFAICIPLTLYWAAVMMYQKSLRHRMELSLLAVLALIFPGILCVLWDSVLHTSAMVFCIIITCLMVVCIPFFGRKRA